jgi:DNA-binding transcriptional MerR regulator
MLKIGDFSRLCQVPVKTLRYYEELGLIQPAQVDAFTSYRYYAVDQLTQIYRILALKDLGFSLEEIGRLLKEGVSPDELRGMLRLRQSEQLERVAEEQERLARIEARLRLIEKEAAMPNHAILLKTSDPMWIASVREVIENYRAVGRLYPEVYAQIGAAAATAVPVALWHNEDSYKERDVDAEAGLLLKHPVTVGGRVQVRELPPVEVATLIHSGSWSKLSSAYDDLARWIAEHGYQLAGPAREIYWKASPESRQDDESYVTEIQLPVVKK